MSSIARGFMKVKQHPYLIPLACAAAFSGGMGLAVLGWTASRKTDVVLNRWTDKAPEERVDWTKPTQKILMTSSTEYDGYSPRFSEEQKLYQIIYGDEQYKSSYALDHDS